jgi:hypothetical protein
MNAMANFTVLDAQALAQVEGGAYVADDYCFRPVLPRPLLVAGPDPTPYLPNAGQGIQMR